MSAYYTLSVTSYSSYSQLHSYVIARCSSLRRWLGSDARSVEWLEVSGQISDTSATGFEVCLMALRHSQVTLMLSTDINITETTYSCKFQYVFDEQ